jgi:hypothetical protein
MPDEALAALIAHELAHAYQHATKCDMRRPTEVIEAEVGHLLMEWGFHL